ncbi:ApaG domain-containing protein [Commensalibacter nepenthis]|uniref:ApaG domain n=1 Tax=Commensalibacter nepenthis TaxID=3043872 RepID=A0ABT6Q701_9PROT|nr:ApaG domain [Commensalibacter sp. TBRC 10068]MDI2112667.1 ApaG domain [Commensalibacter sp. TBRC 10068]
MHYNIPPLLFSPIARTDKKQYQDLIQNPYVFKAKLHQIHIAIYPFWLEEYSFPRKNIYSWGYHVRIENHCLNPIHILRKNWNIIQSNNHVKTINTPIIADNNALLNVGEACDYTACITLDTPSNIIKGYSLFPKRQSQQSISIFLLLRSIIHMNYFPLTKDEIL